MRSSPSGPRDTPFWLTAAPYAHRGLHGAGRPENSRAAFEAAIAAGFGIELDVQLSRDGVAMVFHDATLERLTAARGAVSKRSAAELADIALTGSDETIPTLHDILGLVGGRCAMLIEIKAKGRRAAPLCRAVRRALDGYSGAAAIMSFNPAASRWFARHAPSSARGLVVSEEKKKGWRGRIERAVSWRYARADFLAYDIRDFPSAFAGAARRKGVPVLTWTVRNARDAERASVYADQIIHELPQR